MDFKDIGYISKGALEKGKFRAQVDGLAFKASGSGRLVQVKHSEIDITEWMRVARGYEVKVMSREGNVYKFNGFQESDFSDLKDFFKQHFGKDLKPVELCVKGWNWGEPVFKGSLLSFLVDSKPAFEIPLSEVSRVSSGKHEVALEFHQGDSAPVSLVEMRFHIPSTGIEGEDDPVQSFHDRVLAKADVLQATGDAIASFSEMHCLTPRGRYTIQVYPTFISAHGKTFDYKMPFNTVTRLFLLPHNDQRQMFFVLGLDPPIRQGQTRYPFFILQMMTDETCEITLAMTEDELTEKYGDKLKQEMNGPMYEVFARIMRVMIGKKITVPGSFKKKNNQCAIACSCRATSGYLYPLDKGFIFVHKPALFIKFEDIATVNFERMASGGVSRSFDFDIETKDGTVHHFSSLVRDDYGLLSSFVQEKKLRVKNNKKAHVSYNDEVSSDSDGDHDAYLERMKAEGEEVDSEDEDSDFVAKGSGSEDDLEFDSDAKIDSDDDDSVKGDSEGDEEERASKKRKKEHTSSSQPKKRKKDTSGEQSSSSKGKKSKKDPNEPKKPLSAYFIWMQENRPQIKKDNPSFSVSEIAKKAGELWREVEDKTEWEDKAMAAKERYKEEMKVYKASLKDSGGPKDEPGGPSGNSEVKPSTSKPKPSKKPPSKRPSSQPKPSKRAVGVNPANIKSEEFIDSDEDESSNAAESPSPKKAKKQVTRSLRGKGNTEELVSLNEDESNSESEAELSEEEEEGSESD